MPEQFYKQPVNVKHLLDILFKIHFQFAAIAVAHISVKSSLGLRFFSSWSVHSLVSSCRPLFGRSCATLRNNYCKILIYCRKF